MTAPIIPVTEGAPVAPPTTNFQIQKVARMKGAAIMGGEQGVQQLQDLFGAFSK
jgi:hypothetical protein